MQIRRASDGVPRAARELEIKGVQVMKEWKAIALVAATFVAMWSDPERGARPDEVQGKDQH